MTPAEYIAFDLRTLRNATYSISGYNQSVLTYCPLVSILKGCPFKYSLRQSGHQTDQTTFAGHPFAYSCCHQTLTPRGATSSQSVRTNFGQSVMNALHPRWNCATPATSHYTTLSHRTQLEPNRIELLYDHRLHIKQDYRTCSAFSATRFRLMETVFIHTIGTGRKEKILCDLYAKRFYSLAALVRAGNSTYLQ